MKVTAQVQKRPKTNKIVQKIPENPKISGSVQTPSIAPKCIRMHPNVSKRIQTGPNTFKNVREPRKVHKNFPKLRENFAIERQLLGGTVNMNNLST